ncbi:hypothetical protein [Evansella clarkii]|uniref:hypothetical protein n=1 Tax=Evansella clarkii TaxID=79879 RepID=UPI001065A254|nr:hypothetical protein [Evansella clarkii]
MNKKDETLLFRLQLKTGTVSSSAPAVTRRKKSFASLATYNISRKLDVLAVKKMLVPAGKARAENPFLTALSRQKLVEAVPAESVRLKRKSNNEVR